jgi:hypothetical protein
MGNPAGSPGRVRGRGSKDRTLQLASLFSGRPMPTTARGRRPAIPGPPFKFPVLCGDSVIIIIIIIIIMAIVARVPGSYVVPCHSVPGAARVNPSKSDPEPPHPPPGSNAAGGTLN